MASKWFRMKNKAIVLRKHGRSIRDVEKILRIPRSTLSGWFRNVSLTQKQKRDLNKKWLGSLAKARQKAVLWHNAEKQKRLIRARYEANQVLRGLNLKNKNVIELALAMLYLGEGTKSKVETGMGNSDPLLLKTFVGILIKYYGVDIAKIKCSLHLRADQNPEKLKRFWSQELKLPMENFMYVHLDRRTIGSKTYPDYKGVCLISCGNVAIQRKLINISRGFCERVIKSL